MFRRISLGKARHCSRALSLISDTIIEDRGQRTEDRIRHCLEMPAAFLEGHTSGPYPSLFLAARPVGDVKWLKALHRYNVVKAPAVGVSDHERNCSSVSVAVVPAFKTTNAWGASPQRSSGI